MLPYRVRLGERFAYEVVIDPETAPATDADEVVLAKFSTGSTFVFAPRRPVRI